MREVVFRSSSEPVGVGFNVVGEVDVAVLLAMLTELVEGSAIAYWVAFADEVKRAEFAGDDFVYPWVYSFRVSVVDEDPDVFRVVTVETLTDGLRLVASGRVGVSADLRLQVVSFLLDPDGVVLDVDALDAVVQASLFGEVLFG